MARHILFFMLGGKSADQKNNNKILPKKIETPQKIFLILTMSLQIKNTVLCFEPFVEMFEPTGDFSEYEDDGTIEILYKTVPCKNRARESSGLWSAILWKPKSEVYLGKWIRLEYETSSCFALWWSEMIVDSDSDSDSESEEDSDSTYTESQDDDQDKCEVCGDDSDVTVEDYAGFNMLVCPKCK